jgi:hypothetical protein
VTAAVTTRVWIECTCCTGCWCVIQRPEPGVIKVRCWHDPGCPVPRRPRLQRALNGVIAVTVSRRRGPLSVTGEHFAGR